MKTKTMGMILALAVILMGAGFSMPQAEASSFEVCSKMDVHLKYVKPRLGVEGVHYYWNRKNRTYMCTTKKIDVNVATGSDEEDREWEVFSGGGQMM